MLEGISIIAEYGRVKALHGVSFNVSSGELVAFIGANGAGKTTLLRVLSGVQPLAGGSLTFQGVSLGRLRPERRVELGIVQVPEGRQVFGPMTVEDNLRLGAFRRKGTRQDLERMYELFPMLADHRGSPASTLSGGQHQILAIARALMADPRLLLLDEPSMGLAPLAVRLVYSLIKKLHEAGTTICLVDQNARAALTVAGRVYVMESGAITLSGFAAEVAGNDVIRRAYLAT